MDLIQTVAFIALALFTAQYVLVNIIGVSQSELTTGVTLTNAPTITDDVNPRTNNLPANTDNLDEIEIELKKEYGLSAPTAEKLQLLPDALIQQAVYNENSKGVMPQNQEYGSQQSAEFGNERTDVAQFFKTNPSAFVSDQRHNAYVPNVESWNEQGGELHSQHVNTPHQTLSAANNDNYRQFGRF